MAAHFGNFMNKIILILYTSQAFQPELFSRPDVAGAVLQTPLSLIDSANDPLPPDLQITFLAKP